MISSTGSMGMAAAVAEIERLRAEVKQLNTELAQLRADFGSRKPRAQSDAERAAKYRANMKAKHAGLTQFKG